MKETEKRTGDFINGLARVHDFTTRASTDYPRFNWIPLCKHPKRLTIAQKEQLNTTDGRRGQNQIEIFESKNIDSVKEVHLIPEPHDKICMGLTTKIIDTETNLFILVEPRINTPNYNHFEGTYAKGISGVPIEKCDIIFLDSLFLILDGIKPTAYHIYRYADALEKGLIQKGYNSSGNERRIGINAKVPPISVKGSKDTVFPKATLNEALIEAIKKWGK